MITRHPRATGALLGLALMLMAAPAHAESIKLEGWGPFLLRPGDVLRASFDLQSLPPSSFESSDVLLFMPGVTTLEAIGSFTARLYDRGLLLGSYTAPGDRAVAPFGSWFKSAESIFELGDPTVVDFSTFRNGTFDGAVEFEIHSGLANIYRASDELDLDRTLGPRLASGAGFAPRSMEIVTPAPVPEPSTLLLVATGAGLALRRRIARHRARRLEIA